MARSVFSLNKRNVFVLMMAVTVVSLFYYWQRLSVVRMGTGVGDLHLLDQREIDVAGLPEVPLTTQEKLSSVFVKQIPIAVTLEGKTLNIFSLQASPAAADTLTVLLLHGLGDSSRTWQEVNTLHLLAAWGFKAVAIDLPGHGESQDTDLGDLSTEDFMLALVDKLGTKPVIVAPSMAGSFALPYLFGDPQASTKRAAGFVPVSPVGSDWFTEAYPNSQIQTLILYGVEDIRLGIKSMENLKMLPNSHIAAIPYAGHASFKEQPGLFHRALYHFLTALKASL